MADYLVTDTELTSVADAIRARGGTSASLAFPSGFVTAINNIPSGVTPSGISIDGLATNTQPSGAITLGSSVTSIGDNAFKSKTGITSVTGQNVITINTGAFWLCSGMTEVFFPSCTTLKTEVFRESGILTLTDSHLPLVTSMVQASLGNMRNVTTVSLSSPTSLPNYCLDACSSLESVSFPNVTSIGLGCFRNCTKLTSVSFPKATTTGNNAFSSCGNNADVSSITLDFPAATVIPNNSFNNMQKLTALILRHTSVVELNNISAFANTPMRGYNSQNGTVYVPSALISSYQTATNWSTIYNEGYCTFAAIEGSAYEL